MKKKCEKYCIINIIMNINKYTVQDVNLLFNIKEFTEEFTEMIIFSLIDFFSEYDQIKLNLESCDMTAFQTLIKLLQQITLLQEITNSPVQFSCITRRS